MFRFVLTQFWLCFCLYFCWGNADLSIFHLYTSDPIATRGAACSLPSVQAWRTPMGWGGIQGIWMDVRNVSLTCSILVCIGTWVIWPNNCQQTMMYTHVVQEYVFFLNESDECFAGHEFAETIIGFWMLAGGRMCIGCQELFNDCLSLAQTGDTWWHVQFPSKVTRFHMFGCFLSFSGENGMSQDVPRSLHAALRGTWHPTIISWMTVLLQWFAIGHWRLRHFSTWCNSTTPWRLIDQYRCSRLRLVGLIDAVERCRWHAVEASFGLGASRNFNTWCADRGCVIPLCVFCFCWARKEKGEGSKRRGWWTLQPYWFTSC